MANTYLEFVYPATSITLVVYCRRGSFLIFPCEYYLEFIVHVENYPGSLFCLNLKSTILVLLYCGKMGKATGRGKNPSFCCCLYECKLACPIYSWKGFGFLSSITALTLPQTVVTIEGKNPPNSPLGFF